MVLQRFDSPAERRRRQRQFCCSSLGRAQTGNANEGFEGAEGRKTTHRMTNIVAKSALCNAKLGPNQGEWRKTVTSIIAKLQDMQPTMFFSHLHNNGFGCIQSGPFRHPLLKTFQASSSELAFFLAEFRHAMLHLKI